MRIFATILACMLLAGCTSTAYKDQATALGSAAGALAAAIPSQTSVDAEEMNVPDLGYDLLLSSGPLVYTTECGDQAFASYVAFVQTLSKSQSDQDAAYLALKETKYCRLQATAIAPAAAASSAGSAAPATKPDPLAAQRDKQLKQDAARAAVQAQRSAAQAKIPPPAVCKGQCSADDYLKQLAAYGAAIQAAAAAQNVTDAQTAISNADTAADSLLKDANAPALAAPASDAVSELGKLFLQQMQYDAVKRSVLVFEAAWPTAAPSVGAAVRFRQAQLIKARANALQTAALAAQDYGNDRTKYSTVAERLTIFQYMNGKVTAAQVALTAAEIDPSAAINAFTKAQHTLALAMQDPKAQASTLVADLKAVQTQIAAIEKATSPTTTTSAKSEK